jgi:murein DD-endopeptidase MepM/ murein hydrolase activator NlpD
MRARTSILACIALAGATLGVGAVVDDAPARSAWRFPIRGEHDYGGEQGRFGVKRPDGSVHTGQDVLADCGTPLVAVHRAEVLARSYSKATGHYMVLDAGRFSFVYAHMKSAGNPKKGKTVRAGRRIGSVGNTGASTGVCHLHFEAWKGTWGRGRPTDPLKKLRRWDK